jgi:chromosomal replication initiator protein
MTTLTMTTTPPPPPLTLPALPAGTVTVELIKATIIRYYGLKHQALIGPARNCHVALPRMVAMWLARRLTLLSYPEIGAEFGGRDHSTVIAACRKVEGLLTTDTGLLGSVAAIMRVLRRDSTSEFDGGCVDA